MSKIYFYDIFKICCFFTIFGLSSKLCNNIMYIFLIPILIISIKLKYYNYDIRYSDDIITIFMFYVLYKLDFFNTCDKHTFNILTMMYISIFMCHFLFTVKCKTDNDNNNDNDNNDNIIPIGNHNIVYNENEDINQIIVNIDLYDIKNSDIPDNEICCICLENINSESSRFHCNHIFHKKCIYNWIKNRNVCPICNQILIEDKI